MKKRRADVFVASVAEYMTSDQASATNNLKNVLSDLNKCQKMRDLSRPVHCP